MFPCGHHTVAPFFGPPPGGSVGSLLSAPTRNFFNLRNLEQPFNCFSFQIILLKCIRGPWPPGYLQAHVTEVRKF